MIAERDDDFVRYIRDLLIEGGVSASFSVKWKLWGRSALYGALQSRQAIIRNIVNNYYDF